MWIIFVNYFIQSGFYQIIQRKIYDFRNPEDVIFNYSDRKLSESEKEALGLGLKFAFTPWKIDYFSHFLAFEKFYRQLSREKIYNKSSDTVNILKTGIKTIAFSSFYKFRNKLSDNHKSIIEILRNLAKEKSIIISKPDKGNGVVLLNRNSYLTKMKSILQDRTKFKLYKDDWYTMLLRLQDKVNRFVDELKKKNIINDVRSSQLKSRGCKFGTMYGLPKVHKRGVPMRPVLSTIGTANYNLSKFLVELLSGFTNNEYTVKDSFSFVNEICTLSNNNYTMASFDVTSLFTCIPLDETMNIIIETVFKDQDLFNGFDKKTFKKLLQYCSKDNYFMFDGKAYLQTDGVSMGGCVSPTFANMFLSFHEKRWLENCPEEFKPKFYRRYVDDTFLLFRSQENVTLFLNYLNNQHDNIKFTCDLEKDNKLNFLDISIEKK